MQAEFGEQDVRGGSPAARFVRAHLDQMREMHRYKRGKAKSGKGGKGGKVKSRNRPPNCRAHGRTNRCLRPRRRSNDGHATTRTRSGPVALRSPAV